WKADEATRARLVREYLDNVTRPGVASTDVSCGNGRLVRYVLDEAERTGVPAPTIEQAQAAFEQAMGRPIEAAASELEAFAQRNDARAAVERAEGLRILEHLPQTATPAATTANAQSAAPAGRATAAQTSQVPAPPSGASERDTPPAHNRLT